MEAPLLADLGHRSYLHHSVKKKWHPLLEDKRNTAYIIILWEAAKSGVLMYLFGAKLNQEKEKYIYSRMTNDSFHTT